MGKYPDEMKMKCHLFTDDGGKTWSVSEIFYLVADSLGHSKKDDFIDSSEFEGMELKRVNK